MKKNEVYYTFIEDKEHYSQILEEVLAKGTPVVFFKDGLIIELLPGMTAEEIEAEEQKMIQEFETKKTKIRFSMYESLLGIAKFMSRLAKEKQACYETTYRGKPVRAVPGTTDFDILIQIIDINMEYLKGLKEEERVDMQARGGQSYMYFGKEIEEVLKSGKNVIAHFNNTTIPFTTDMTRILRFDDDTITDAYTFSMMFGNMRIAKYNHQVALDGCNDPYIEPQHKRKVKY